MMINSSQPYIIFLIKGDLSLFNIEFIFTVYKNQYFIKLVYPSFSIIGSSYPALLIKSLSIISCVFNGLTGLAVNMMLYMRNFNSLYIDDCFFQNAMVSRNSLIQCSSYQQYMEINIKNSQILNIEVLSSHNWGIVSIGLYDQFQTLIIDKCTFENCQLIGHENISAVFDIISYEQSMKLVITNNRFTNCFGYYAGALHNALQTVNCNISNNEFSGNGKYGLDQKGSDAYLQWISKLSGWTAENTHNKIMIMLNGSKSTNIDSISYQISLNSGFINLPKEWAYCVAKDQLTVKCICNPDSTSYLFEICQKYKLCQFDLIHQTTQDCPCLISGDPRAGIICPAYCVKDSTTPEYVCDANISNYSVEQCQQEKLYKYDLIHQTVANCPCLSTGDPRAGGICPAYCTSKDIPTSDCVCDSNSTIYHRSTCQFEKQYCQINSNSSVQKDSCICTGTNYPYGCKCPTDPTQLSSIPQNRCECRSWGDPRAGKGECPAYCIKGQTTSNCVCETGSSMYPQSVCEKDKLCFDDLVHQTKANCQCLMKGDSRAGGICPSYCKSKDELTVNCMCELDSSYPQATCEKDKLCIVDLIHQSTSNCPCLSANDPRGESVCKQTDIDPSDPDPTDPVIPDPSEQDPETDQEQEQDDGIKQQFDDEDQSEIQNEQSSAFQMIWIIYIAVGALFVVVLILLIIFAKFRLRNKKKQIQKLNKNKEIQKEIIISTLEEEKKHEKTNFDNSQSINVKNIQISSQQLSQSLKIDQQMQINSVLKMNKQTQSSQSQPQSQQFKVKIILQSQLKIKPCLQYSFSSGGHLFNQKYPQIVNNKSLQQNNILKQLTHSKKSQSSQNIQTKQLFMQKQKVSKIFKHEIEDNTNLKNKEFQFINPIHTNELSSKEQIGINQIKIENNKNKQNNFNIVSKNLHTKPNISINKVNKKINKNIEIQQFKTVNINNQQKNNQKQKRNNDNDQKNTIKINITQKDIVEKRNKTRKNFDKERNNKNIEQDNKIGKEFDKDIEVKDSNSVNFQDLNILSRIMNSNSYDRSNKSNVAQQVMKSSLSTNNEPEQQQYNNQNETLSTIYSESNSVFSYESSNMNSSRISNNDEEDKIQ